MKKEKMSQKVKPQGFRNKSKDKIWRNERKKKRKATRTILESNAKRKTNFQKRNDTTRNETKLRNIEKGEQNEKEYNENTK